MTENPAPVRTVTKSVTIDRPADEIYAFLADLNNWPKWAIINVLSAEPGDESGWWKITIAGQGQGEIRLHAHAATRVLDHDYRDSDFSATVPARVIPNGRGADFMMTFAQPEGLEDDAFDELLTQFEVEFETLKKILEKQ